MRAVGNNRDRRGVTLFEMLIAIAVLMILISMVYPSARRLLRDYDLKKAGEAVQNGMARARNRAISEGVEYQVRFEIYGQRFVIIPLDQGLAETAGMETTTQQVATTSDETVWKVSGKLPEELQFRLYGNNNVPTTQLSAEAFGGLNDADQLSQVSWGPPVLFRPDGTADDAVIELFHDQQKRLVQVYVRGLTGAVALSAPQEEGT